MTARNLTRVLLSLALMTLPLDLAAQPASPAPQHADPHAGHGATPGDQSSGQPREPIPPVTDADREAAFPPHLEGHAVHDRAFNYVVLFDTLEWQGTGSGGAHLENTTWIGGDLNRLWLRIEGASEDGRVDSASVDALWGHSISRWWDLVVGARQDVRPGDPQAWAAFGIQGLAPYWFEIEATGYLGSGGRTAARFEAEYDLLLTNRLVLQPVVEFEFHGKSDPGRGIGAGLSSVDAGIRLRYEVRRELAPYVGVTWERKLFGTADLARGDGHDPGTVRLAVGVRTWF